jgi:hypothetical protein
MMEGKVLDGKEQPLAQVKIRAELVQPQKGCDPVETVTGADGIFRLQGLCPDSEYSLSPRGDNWQTEAKQIITSPSAGKTQTLASPLIIRFTSRDGAITDSKTGCQWAADPGKPMNWEQANQYVRNLKLSVYSDWRLPTRAELSDILDKSKPGTIDPHFKLKGPCAWSSEKKDPGGAWLVNLNDGKADWTDQSFFNVQVLAVRSAKY